MDTSYCNPQKCEKKETCNHHIVKPMYGKRIATDMSDICLPDYRLYIKGDYYKSFPNKNYYKSVLSFYDNICSGSECGNREIYDKNNPMSLSKIHCKLGKGFNCNHPKHPDNEMEIDCNKTIQAENEAFKKAGITEGTVTYICPKCGGEAIANRYKHDGMINGLGSGCPKCGTSHT